MSPVTIKAQKIFSSIMQRESSVSPLLGLRKPVNINTITDSDLKQYYLKVRYSCIKSDTIRLLYRRQSHSSR